jgi:hypothetical protein
MTNLFSAKSLGLLLLALFGAASFACGDDDSSPGADGGGHPHKDAGPDERDSGDAADSGASTADKFSFFVTSDTSMTGALGGLAGADARCLRLATASGAHTKTWHAYLSVDKGTDDKPIDARDRIGSGPWYNVHGELLAKDLGALHARTGDPDLFIDEMGGKINGQWSGSPMPVQHDVLTGSNGDGTLLTGKTCADWTSDSADDTAQVGHTDGLGPNMNPDPPYSSWNSAHENGGCNDTAPRGGAGKLYCFAID